MFGQSNEKWAIDEALNFIVKNSLEQSFRILQESVKSYNNFIKKI